jgi:hypothetical protein
MIVLAMLIWASYEGLRPRVTNWMTPIEAIRVFTTPALGASFEEYLRKLNDLQHADETLYLQIHEKPDSPELEGLKHRKHDIEGQILVLRATLSTNQQSASWLIYNGLDFGTLLAEGYDADKEELTIIPTQYWKSMRLLSDQLSEAGGIGFHHYRNLMFGKNPCYAPEAKLQAIRCRLPLAGP